MKLLRVKLSVILVAVGFAVPVYLAVSGVDWMFLKTTNEGTFFYDAMNITNPTKETIGISLKTVYSEKFKEREGLNNLGHTIGLWEVNCAEKMIRLLTISHYSNEGEMLGPSSPVLLPDWESIVTNTVLEDLFKNVCK